MSTRFFAISRPWRVTAFLTVAAALNYADRAALSSVIPPLRQDLGLSDASIGLVGSLFLWSYALASPVAGLLADRYSRSRLVIFSLVAWSVVTAATGLANGLVVLCLMRLALGLAESIYLPAAAALLGDHHGPATRGKAMSIHVMGLHFGVVLGGACAGFLAERYGWRLGFIVLGLAGLGLAMLAPLCLVDGPAKTKEPARASASAALAYLLRVPSFHMILLCSMLAGVAVWIFFSWLPLYFREAFDMNLGSAGFLGTFLLKAPALLGLALCGWLSDKLAQREARRRVLLKAFAYFGAAPTLLVFLDTPHFATVVAALGVFSLCQGFRGASEHTILCDVVPPAFRSTAVGLMNAAATSAGGLGVLITGLLKQDWGLGTVFAAASILFVIAGIAMLVAYTWFMPRDISRALNYEHATRARPHEEPSQ